MKNRVQAERERRVRESQLPASTPPVISAEQSSSEINAVRQKLSALREADPPPSQQEEAPASRASQITIELVRTKQELLDSPPSQRSALRAKVEELEQEAARAQAEAPRPAGGHASTAVRGRSLLQAKLDQMEREKSLSQGLSTQQGVSESRASGSSPPLTHRERALHLRSQRAPAAQHRVSSDR